MVDDTMIVVNLDVLACVLAVLVCAVAVLLMVVRGMYDRHKWVLRDLHEAMDERDYAQERADAWYGVVRWVDTTVGTLPHKEWVERYVNVKKIFTE